METAIHLSIHLKGKSQVKVLNAKVHVSLHLSPMTYDLSMLIVPTLLCTRPLPAALPLKYKQCKLMAELLQLKLMLESLQSSPIVGYVRLLHLD